MAGAFICTSFENQSNRPKMHIIKRTQGKGNFFSFLYLFWG